jgi:DNA invertase Pin-like site-specific DNA recombinase
MGRKPGPNPEKLKKIRAVLAKTPNGIWVREIARQTNLDRTTVSIYLSRYMQNEVEEIFPVKGSLIKIVRLKK